MIHFMALDRCKPNPSPPAPEEHTQPLWLGLHTPRRLTSSSCFRKSPQPPSEVTASLSSFYRRRN